MTALPLLKNLYLDYQPKQPPRFHPDTIILTKGSFQTAEQRDLVKAICDLYPQAQVVKEFDLPHNRIELGSSETLKSHYRG